MNDVVPDLRSQILREHELACTSLQQALIHALNAGELLLRVRASMRHGQWTPWLHENVPAISPATVRIYLRLAAHKDELPIGELTSVASARRYLAELPRRQGMPWGQKDAVVLREQGLKQHEIAERLEVSRSTVSLWLNPDYRKREQAAARERMRQQREGKKALEQRELKRLSQKVGGDLGAAYSLLRRTLDTLQRALDGSATSAERQLLRTAMTSLHNSEDALTQVIRNAGTDKT